MDYSHRLKDRYLEGGRGEEGVQKDGGGGGGRGERERERERHELKI